VSRARNIILNTLGRGKDQYVLAKIERIVRVTWVKNNHFACYALDRTQQHIWHHDSLQDHVSGATQSDKQHVAKAIASIATDQKQKDGWSKAADWPITTCRPNHVQHNGYDCGIFSMQFAESFAMGDTGLQSINQADINNWRVYYGSALVRNKLQW